MNPFLVAITGGIGTGKSAVSQLLASYCNKPLLDIDKCCRHLLDKGEEGWVALQAGFGNRFFDNCGEVDRPLLRQTLFSEDLIRKKVDNLLHPLARTKMYEEAKRQGHGLLFIEVPLLYEAGWEADVTEVIVVITRADIQYNRIMQRDGVSMEQAVASVAAQMDLRKKAERADYVIDNSSDWLITRKKVVLLAEQIEKSVLS